jgi:hypothetical protein
MSPKVKGKPRILHNWSTSIVGIFVLQVSRFEKVVVVGFGQQKGYNFTSRNVPYIGKSCR